MTATTTTTATTRSSRTTREMHARMNGKYTLGGMELRLRNHIFPGTGQSASGRLHRGWGGLGGAWRRAHYWYSNPQHTSMTVSTRACRGRAVSRNTSNIRGARAGLLGSRPPAPVQTASRTQEFPAKSLKFAGKASQLNLVGNSTTPRLFLLTTAPAILAGWLVCSLNRTKMKRYKSTDRN